MSRRCHHGSPRHVPLGRPFRRPATATPERHVGLAATGTPATYAADEGVLAELHAEATPPEMPAFAPASTPVQAIAAVPAPAIAPPVTAPATRYGRPTPPPPARSMGPRPELRPTERVEPGAERNATAPQLRRFIKSRAYVPMHELRRRFAITGGDDDVTPVDLEPRKRVFVGLPEREGRLLGELLRAGDIGYELSFDPISPIVVGVYPMRPVTRG